MIKANTIAMATETPTLNPTIKTVELDLRVTGNLVLIIFTIITCNFVLNPPHFICFQEKFQC